MKKETKLFILPLLALSLSGCKFLDMFKKAKDEPEQEQKQEEEKKEEEQKKAEVKLDKTSISLKVGEEEKLTARASGGKGDVTWSSSDANIATVDQTGLVKGIAVGGPVTITASYDNVTATCSVEVVPADAKVVRSISLSPATLTLDNLNNTSGQITPIVVADEGVDTTVAWTSSDPSVVTVSKASGNADEAITVSMVALGNATITATCGGKTASCEVSVIQQRYELNGMVENANIVKFRTNVADSADVFIGETSNIIEVGDENGFEMMPRLTILDDQTMSLVDQSNWPYSYSLELKEVVGDELNDVNETQYVVFDEQKCSLDFTAAAVGKTFQISVAPGGLTTAQQASDEYHSVIRAKVVTGYNVYDADHLAYFNDITFISGARQDGNDQRVNDINDSWIAFRNSKSLNATYLAPRILLQSDIQIRKENLPEIMFFSESDGVAAEQVGKMVDSTDVYARYADGFTFNGNYFNVDSSELPVNGNKWGSDGISHSTLFKVAEINADPALNSSLVFKNCTYYGNAPRNDDTKYADGLIFFKVQNYHEHNPLTVYATFDNFNVTRACISFYAEYGPTDITIKNCKITEGYANGVMIFMNGDMHIQKSVMTGFGGPIIVTNGKNDTITGIHIDVDADSTLENWVTGNEPWFVSTHANTAIPAIIGADACPNNFGKTFLKTVGSDKLMNFIVVNRGDNPYMTFTRGTGSVGFDRDTAPADLISNLHDNQYNYFNTDNGNIVATDSTNAVKVYTGPLGGSYLDLMQHNGSFGYICMVFELLNL